MLFHAGPPAALPASVLCLLEEAARCTLHAGVQGLYGERQGWHVVRGARQWRQCLGQCEWIDDRTKPRAAKQRPSSYAAHAASAVCVLR